MTNEEIKEEFNRWIDAKRCNIWYKLPDDVEWHKTSNPNWLKNVYYIVDDKQAELRKLQIDEPETQFQIKINKTEEWVDVSPKIWEQFCTYRVKPLEWYEDPDMIGKPVWVKDYKNFKWQIELLKAYNKNNPSNPFVTVGGLRWKYAKPVKPEDLYQGEKK